MPTERSRKKLILIDKSISYTLMILLAAFFLFPLIYMISTSLNPDELDILKRMGSIKAFIPSPASLKNYSDVFARMPFLRFIFNSLLIVSSTVIAGLFVNSMMAFGLARFTFKGRKLLVSVIVALMIIPFETIAVPLLLMTNRFGWLDSYHVQIIPFIANPFYIFLFYQFFIGFPKALEEAALIDGASWFKIYWKIAMPLSKPILASVAILHFLMQWGFFLWPLMVTRGPEYRPLPVAMQVFFGQYPRDWGDIMAFATMMTAPILILFVVLQGQYVKSVSQTGIK
ncbi:sugar ABC transporter permease [Kosmotoga arenicorallina S304]|uniref:Sugar ABC transporter permease n=1 Tax=Kosmotoga arenicorallina S304 TaxID=1453497 RepID=A0A176K1F3_9BACT|nr:carbohydrate ABC transporter permease [Kosmotoga arenicorallina]OAA30729.1 sugar ABC transporter permease [Kosmotoga arenicorallina S304]